MKRSKEENAFMLHDLIKTCSINFIVFLVNASHNNISVI